MIKLYPREMNNLSRILTIMLCFAPVAFASAASPVATTAGSNLTAYNPSNANNNQWAMMSNGRYDGNNATAKVDFGNCNALILRCAQPKCSNGGCSDYFVASAIVKGCVQSNSSCKQYGADLEEYMSAQLVASSNAKINEQNAAAQQAAAQAAAQQSQQQMQEMQYQMQQMQAQMAQQQAESQQQLQAALAQQAAQSAAALENMKTAATDAAKENEAGVSAYQQDAINRGISADVLERQKITGQIMTELENAEVSLKEVKTVMNAAFEYAKCDARGNNCEGPKRIKKWRELATEFLTPYDNTIDKVYDALELAQLVGVNLSDIYMMLNNSCNRWGQYMCERGAKIEYVGNNGTPYSCPAEMSEFDKMSACSSVLAAAYMDKKADSSRVLENCMNDKIKSSCKPCTLLKVLSSEDEVYEGWVNPTVDSTSNGTVVACASGALDSSALFRRRTKNKNGAGLVDIDKLDVWLNQNEPRKTKGREAKELIAYCDASEYVDVLEKATLSKSAQGVNNYPLCVKDIKAGMNKSDFMAEEKEECGYVSPIFAICDTHLYNVGKDNASESVKTDKYNCTTKATKGEYKDQANAKITKGLDKIVWADSSQSGGITCKVRFCKENYEPTDEGCIKREEGWDAKSDNYKNKKQDYDSHQKEMFGDMKEIIGLKTTVVSQQMYKQYEYLSATLRRLKTQLEKATLTATLEAAGAKDDDSSSGLLGSSSSKASRYRDCSGKTMQGTLDCLRENYNTLRTQIDNKKCDRYAKAELKLGINTANDFLTKQINDCKGTGADATCNVEPSGIEECKTWLRKYNAATVQLDKEIRESEYKLRDK